VHAFENRSYLGEFEAEFKKALARESGAQGVLFDEKNRKSRDTVPLSACLIHALSNKQRLCRGDNSLYSVDAPNI
jgi:hypothetical protein